jgi:hypothetical protein
MKLKEFETYQFVKFKGKTQKSFNVEARDKIRDPEYILTLLPSGIIEVIQGSEHILVPLNNVSYMAPLEETKKAAKSKSKD